jgi:hypothetical protein
MAYYTRYTPRATSASQAAPASEPQLNFITSLLRDRQVDELHRITVEGEVARGITKSRASDIIGDLKALPWVPKQGAAAPSSSSEAAAEGVYELDGTFYAVRTSRNDKTRRYAYKAIITDTAVDFEFAKGAVYRLADARVLTVDEVEALSLQFSRCFLCGIKLKAKDSKARGVGPVCAKKITAANAVC